MKRLLAVAALVLIGIGTMYAQYPIITVAQTQQEPQDSLVLADSLFSVTSHWTLQASPHIRHVSPYAGDTVTVIGLCVVPGKVLTFTNKGYTMLLYDTAANPYPWGGIFVRCSADTATHIADGFLNVNAGNVIAMTGVLSEFPTNSYNSATQLQPIPGIPITILETGRPIPPPPHVTVDQFWNNSRVKYSTGEQYEGMIVQFTDLTVTTKENLSRGTFNMVDSAGNQITEYDASRYFTLKGTSIDHPYPDSIWTIRYAQLGNGTKVDSIRGYITTVSGSNNSRGYQIAPIYHGDIVFGRVPLAVSTHRRNPVIVTPDSAPRVSVVVKRQTGGFPIQTVSLLYSVNNSDWTALPMSLSDTTYKATIPQEPADAFVKYFVKAVDSLGTSTIYANSASGSAGSDTGRGFFFYNSLNRPLTIHDIQYTPYPNGRGAYIGATNVAISGVVTADTGHIGRFPLSTGGTNAWYMQTGNQPWNGIWFDDTSAAAAYSVRNGDSITVTGNITEDFDVTQVYPFTAPVVVRSSGLPEPQPVLLTTGTFGPGVGNGVPSAEKWEGMLVRFENVTVTDTTSWTFSDPTEYAVDDGSGPVLVRRDGVNNFTNQVGDTIGGRRLLRPNYHITYIQGVMYFSFNRYKLTPRGNTDFGIVTGVDISHTPGVPVAYSLDQNYPNPFNPSTTIRYSLPSAGKVTLKVYNLLGQEVRTLVNEVQPAGNQTAEWDGRNNSGNGLSSGVYIYRFVAKTGVSGSITFSQISKALLLR